MTKRLNYLLNFPKEYELQMYEELKKKCVEHNAYKGNKNVVIIRWNDSGDFFAKKYLEIVQNVMKKLKLGGFNIIDDAYTKIADVAKNSEIGSVSFSSGANKKEADQIDKDIQKISEVVPKELFQDLNLQKINDIKELKNRIARKYQFHIKNVITYDELLSTKKGNKAKWHVIVTPDDGDDAAARNDVKTVLLTIH
jgi:hypothetical protein